MKIKVNQDKLKDLGLDKNAVTALMEAVNALPDDKPEILWSILSKKVLRPHPFSVHLYFFTLLFPEWRDRPDTATAWVPTESELTTANIAKLMVELNLHTMADFHAWTTNPQDFWQHMATLLNIQFTQTPEACCDLTHGLESPAWFPGATLNIVNSCFQAPASATAIIYNQGKELKKLTYGELNDLSNRIANSLIKCGLEKGNAIAIAMPMNIYAIAIYLGILKIGGIVVSIADSFSSQEIATRLKIADAKAVFTQDFSLWGGKKIPLYEKVKEAASQSKATVNVIVLPCENTVTLDLRKDDFSWDNFLVDNTHFSSVVCHPMTACNILFSSGTTADPKAIIWNHTTAIKAASDAYLHQNIQANDVLAWPTNLGWMMGPWLIFATLINKATIAIYNEAPKDRGFGEFVQQAKVTMLGVVPTLVSSWRQTHCMENLDWSAIKVFSSTGECSNAEDMLYLMSLAQYKPVIEYCGGTEIGGAYLSSTVIQKNSPSLFSTPVMGLNLAIIDEDGNPTTQGEVAIVPPSIGLSTVLLNANHHDVYFENMPTTPDGKTLRRHGDQIKQFANGYYCILGRVDDTMKLGGIKTSAAEIERALVGIPHINEIAAIALPPPDKGPNQLIIFAATSQSLNKTIVMKEMQKRINAHLNPLFKIHDIVFVSELPKTASNKIMRRVLRKNYLEKKDFTL